MSIKRNLDHFFRATLTFKAATSKLIIDRWIQTHTDLWAIIVHVSLFKIRGGGGGSFDKKEKRNTIKAQKVLHQKLQKWLIIEHHTIKGSCMEHSIYNHSISAACYVTICVSHTVSLQAEKFLWFLIMHSLWFLDLCFTFLTRVGNFPPPPQMCLIRSTIA